MKRYLFSLCLSVISLWSFNSFGASLYFACQHPNQPADGVYVVDLKTGATTQIYTSTYSPYLTGFEGDKSILPELFEDTITILNGDGSVYNSYATSGHPYAAIQATDGTSDIYYVQYVEDQVWKLDPPSGQTQLVATVDNAHRIVIRSDGTLFVSQWSTDLGQQLPTIFNVDEMTTVATTTARITTMEADQENNIFFTDYDDWHTIYKLDDQYNLTTFWSDPLVTIHGLSYDPISDKLYSIGYNDGDTDYSLFAFDLSNGTMTTYIDGITGVPSDGVYLYTIFLNSAETIIPEPATILLLSGAVIGALKIRRKG